MKSNSHPFLYFSAQSQKEQKQELTVTPLHNSPYLRAVLSERKSSGPARILSMANSSMGAALRYIAHKK
jgi:hypothetical protein